MTCPRRLELTRTPYIQEHTIDQQHTQSPSSASLVFGITKLSSSELATIVSPQTTMAVPDTESRQETPLRCVEAESADERRTEQELAPVDGGSAAWRILGAAFVFETLLWGNPRVCLFATRSTSLIGM